MNELCQIVYVYFIMYLFERGGEREMNKNKAYIQGKTKFVACSTKIELTFHNAIMLSLSFSIFYLYLYIIQ